MTDSQLRAKGHAMRRKLVGEVLWTVQRNGNAMATAGTGFAVRRAGGCGHGSRTTSHSEN